MICALAFCPHPPLLVPEVAAGAAAELDALRAACDEAVATVLATAPDRVVLLGGGSDSGAVPAESVGSFRPYGVALDVPLTPASVDGLPLPLSLTVGAWLLARSGWSGERAAYQVDLDPMGGPGGRRAVAEELAALSGRTALLVLGDGSNTRSEKAPGSYDPAGEVFDAQVAAVLAGGDPAAGLKLRYEDGRAVGAQGWSAWRTAFHAARREDVHDHREGGREGLHDHDKGSDHAGTNGLWEARVSYDAAPYGVGYLVATWI